MAIRPTLERRGLWSGGKHRDLCSSHSFIHLPLESAYSASARTAFGFIFAACLIAPAAFSADLTEADRIELIRGLNSEYATVKDFLPRSKKPLDFSADGTYDQNQWALIGKQTGPAARVGDLVQVTHVTLEKDRILIEINNGIKGSGHWYDHVQGGTGSGGPNRPIYNGPNDSNASSGTNIQLLFHEPLMAIKASEVKKILSPILDFDKHSATEMYSDSLSPEIQKAIAEKRAQKGMDRDQVFMALGRPERKVRETKDGVDLEDYIFGKAPGKIVFVTFEGSKVIKVKETYAGLGLEAAAPNDTIH